MSSRVLQFACLLLIFVGTLFFYGPMRDGGYRDDDLWFVRCASHGAYPENFRESNPPSALEFFLQKPADGFRVYRPLAALSFKVTHDFFGLSPSADAHFNLGLHFIAAALLYLVLSLLRTNSAFFLRLLAVGVFLLHPWAFQTVTWASARGESMMLVFGLMAVIFAIRWPRRIVLPAIFALLSALSKETGILWFFALPLFVFWSERGDSTKVLFTSTVKLLGALLVCGLLVLFLRSASFSNSVELSAYGQFEWGSLTNTEQRARLWRVVRFCLSPVMSNSLSSQSIGNIVSLALGLISIVVVTLGSFRLRTRSWPMLLTCVIGFVLPLVAQFSTQSLDDEFAASRAFYVPLFALCTLFYFGFEGRPKLGGIVGILLIALTIPTSRLLQDKTQENRQLLSSFQSEFNDVVQQIDPAQVDRIVILDFPRYDCSKLFTGLIDFEEARALKPFTHADFHVAMVGFNEPRAGLGFLTPFPEIFERNASRTAFLRIALVDDVTTKYSLVDAGLSSNDGMNQLKTIAPRPNNLIVIDRKKTKTYRSEFVIDHESKPNESYELHLIGAQGTLMMIPLEASVRTDKKTKLLAPPLGPKELASMGSPFIYAWSISIRDAERRVVHKSPFQLSVITLEN